MKKTLYKDNCFEFSLVDKNTLHYVFKGKLMKKNKDYKEGSISINKDVWFSYGVKYYSDDPSTIEFVYIDIVNPETNDPYGTMIPVLDGKITKKMGIETIKYISGMSRNLNFCIYSIYHKKAKNN